MDQNWRTWRLWVSLLIGLGLVGAMLLLLAQGLRAPTIPITAPGQSGGQNDDILLQATINGESALIPLETVAGAISVSSPAPPTVAPPGLDGGLPPRFWYAFPLIASVAGESSSQPPSRAPEELQAPTVSSPTLIGFPSPGGIVTFVLSLTPNSADMERVDSFLLYTPQGWQIQTISPAPPAAPGCSFPITEAHSSASGRGIAYWGNDAAPLNLNTLPPTLPAASGCGPYAPGVSLTFTITVQIDSNAASCPGSPWVGIPLDSVGFTSDPQLPDSMPSYLRGDGNSANPLDWKINWSSHCPLPNLGLEKLIVGDGNRDCPPGQGQDTYYVTPGTPVTYCYRMLNFSGVSQTPLVTMSLQTIDDNVVGNVVKDWPLIIPGQQGGYTFTMQTVSGSPGSCLDNTAIWTATTSLGYGQVPMSDLSAPFTNTQYTSTANDTASVCFVPSTDGIKLPIVAHDSQLR